MRVRVSRGGWGVGVLLLMGPLFCGPQGVFTVRHPLGSITPLLRVWMAPVWTHVVHKQAQVCGHEHSAQTRPDCSWVICSWTSGSSVSLSCHWKFEVTHRTREQEEKADFIHYNTCDSKLQQMRTSFFVLGILNPALFTSKLTSLLSSSLSLPAIPAHLGMLPPAADQWDSAKPLAWLCIATPATTRLHVRPWVHARHQQNRDPLALKQLQSTA